MDNKVDTMASYSKVDGGWRVRVRRNGVSKSRVFPSKGLAQSWGMREESDLLAIEAGTLPDKTLRDLMDEYCARTQTEKGRVQRILQHLGTDPSKKLKNLDVSTFRNWQAKRLGEVAPSSVLRERKTLNAALRYGIRLRWLRENPLASIDPPKDGNPRETVWSADQIEKFLHAAGYAPDAVCVTSTSRVAACLLFGLETAMRSSEIVRARRADITGRVLRVPQTKNGSPRDVPLSLKALAILEQLPEIKDTLFSLTDRSRDALFRKVRRRAGIEGVDFHSARRTALTRMAGIYDVLTLAKISGHRDLRILMAHYYAPDFQLLATRLDE